VLVAAGQQKKSGASRAVKQRSIFETQYTCRANGPEGALHAEDLEILGFTIGASTIRDVQKRFPNTHSVKLAFEEEAEEGICVKNNEGIAAVFATGVMGAPDTLVAIYLAPVRLAESSRLTCRMVNIPSKMFGSASGIRTGAPTNELGKIIGGKIPREGSFCAAYQIPSRRGPLQLSKADTQEGRDFTGVEGFARTGKLEWVKVFGIASD